MMNIITRANSGHTLSDRNRANGRTTINDEIPLRGEPVERWTKSNCSILSRQRFFHAVNFSIPNYKCFYGVESPYQCKMLLCNHHHTKPFDESTFIPTILSPRMKEFKSSFNFTSKEKNPSNASYQRWMQLVQRLHDRTAPLKLVTDEGASASLDRQPQTLSQPTSPLKGLRRQKSWSGRDTTSPWNAEKLNSKKQVITLINHYSNMLSVDNNDKFTQRFNDRPKSILRPLGSLGRSLRLLFSSSSS
jgi:hypothetical protein